MAKMGFALVTLVSVAFGAPAQTVVADTSVTHPLNRLAHDSIEHVACLYGRAAPDTIFLLSYVLPQQTPVGSHNVVGDTDDCWSALAHWHTHVVPRDSIAESYLYYSLTDEHAFTKTANSLLAIVAVPNMWCLWTRKQVQLGYTMNLTPLPAVRAQCTKIL